MPNPGGEANAKEKAADAGTSNGPKQSFHIENHTVSASRLQQALELAGKGLPVFPCRNTKGQKGDKAPVTRGGFHDATTDPDQIRAWWSTGDHLIGMPTGEASGIVAVDLDVCKETGEKLGLNAIKEAGLAEMFKRCPAIETQSGGLHFYFAADGETRNTTNGLQKALGRKKTGVDVRGNGGYVIAPDGDRYNLKRSVAGGHAELAPMPQELREKLFARLSLADTAKAATGNVVPFKIDTGPTDSGLGGEIERDGRGEALDLLNAIPADASEPEWFAAICAAKDAGLSAQDVEAWSATAPAKYRQGEATAKWHRAPINPRNSAPLAGLARSEGGANLSAVARRHIKPQAASTAVKSASTQERKFPELDLTRDKAGNPFQNVANFAQILMHSPEWRDVLGFNNWTRRRTEFRAPPADCQSPFPRELQDDDTTAIQVWFQSHGFPKATEKDVHDAIKFVCNVQKFDPVQEWLEGLQWDGKPRLDTWLTDYAGVADTPLNRTFARKTLVSMAARITRPGCKVDTMLVFEGGQGVGKSTIARTLAGEANFIDRLPSIERRPEDAANAMVGKIVVEMSELVHAKKDQDDFKSFLTAQVDEVRLPYARSPVRLERRSVFIGTTNRDDWLLDETGGRRFWPVRVAEVQPTDVAGLATARDQLFAEALAALNAGENWWLEGAQEAEAFECMEERKGENPLEAVVARMAGNKRETSTTEIIDLMASDDMARALGKVSPKAIGAALRGLGYNRTSRRLPRNSRYPQAFVWEC